MGSKLQTEYHKHIGFLWASKFIRYLNLKISFCFLFMKVQAFNSKSGNTTFMVSIPIGLAKALGWKKGTKLSAKLGRSREVILTEE